MKHALGWGVVLASVMAFAGCGGGGGKSAGFLHVTQTTPASHAVAVARNVKPQLIFSDVLDAASVSAETVQLLGPGGVVPAAITLAGNRLQLKPSAGLLPGGAEYTIRLGEGLRSRSGKRLEAVFTAQFSTAAQEWGTPETLPGRASSTHVLMVDDNGTALLAWPDSFDGQGRVRASVYRDGAWGEVHLARPAISGAIQGLVGSAIGNGRFMLAWEQQGTDDVSGVFSAIWSNGSWSEPHRLSGAGSYNLHISSGRSGTAMLAWITPVDANTRALMRTLYKADGWQVAQEQARGDIKALDVASRGDSGWAAIWAMYDPERKRDRVWVTVSHDGVYSSGPLSNASNSAEMPAIMLEPDGRATAAWLEAAPNGLSRLTVSHLDRSNWSVRETLDAERTLFGRPLLLAGADGRVTVLWNAVVPDGGGYVVSSVQREGGIWGVVSDIPGSGPNNRPYDLSAIVDVGGRITAAWQSVSGGLIRVGYSHGMAGAWAETGWLGDGDGVDASDSNPRLGIDAKGNIVAAWGQMKVGQVTIRVRRYE